MDRSTSRAARCVIGSKGNRKGHFFEHLEHRVLLDAIVVDWVGQDGATWNNQDHWQIHGTTTPVIPNNDADHAYIVNALNSATRIVMDIDATISGIQASAGLQLDLNNHNLTVDATADPHQSPTTPDPNAAKLGIASIQGGLYLINSATTPAASSFIAQSVVTSGMNTNNTPQGVIHRYDLFVGANAELHSKGLLHTDDVAQITIQGDAKLTVDGNALIDGGPTDTLRLYVGDGPLQLNATVPVSTAKNGHAAEVMVSGNLIAGSGGPLISSIAAGSHFTVKKDATIEAGLLTSPNGGQVSQRSEWFVSEKAAFTVEGKLMVGNVGAAHLDITGTETLVTVKDLELADNSDARARCYVKVSDKGNLEVTHDATIAWTDVTNRVSSDIEADGDGTVVHVAGKVVSNGRILISDKASTTIDGSLWFYGVFAPVFGPTNSCPAELSVTGGATVKAASVDAGTVLLNSLLEDAILTVTGATLKITSATAISHLGQGGGVVKVTVTKVNNLGTIDSAGTIIEGTGAIVTGDGAINAHPKNKTTDPPTFAPGVPANPTATLILGGDFDATETMILNAYLKPSAGSSNLLHITGAAQIAGTIAFFFPDNTTTTSFHAGDTFTVLTADGGLTGTFSNLPYDPDHNGVLPINSSPIHILPVGLRWQVQYTSTSVILKVIPVSPAVNLHTTSIAAAPSNEYIGARSVSFAWTNHDPDILYSILEVQDYDTGNYFAAARVEGNASSLTFNPAGNPGPYGFQVGGYYTVRLRTFTAAGAAYSTECSFQVPDFAQAPQNSSPDIEFIPNPEDESSYIIKLTGVNAADDYTVMAIGSVFPDRWQILTSTHSESFYDDDLGWSYSGNFSDSTLSVTAYFAFVGEHDGNYYLFPAPFATPVRSLDTPDVTTSYDALTGFTLSWDAIDGAEGYTLIDLGNLTLSGSYVDVPCGTSVNVTAKVANGFERTGYYAIVAYRHDIYGNLLFSEVSDFVDLSKANDGGPMMGTLLTTVSDTQVLLTWNNGAATEDGYVIQRKTNSGAFEDIAVLSTLPADNSYVDSNVSAGNTYVYRVRAVRDLWGGLLDSDYGNSYDTQLLT
jgi:hypothetical protein